MWVILCITWCFKWYIHIHPWYMVTHLVPRFSSVKLFSLVRLFVTPWISARQAFLSTNSRSLPRLMSIQSVMPFSHLILCHPLLLLPSIFPSITVFSNESALRIRWLKVHLYNWLILNCSCSLQLALLFHAKRRREGEAQLVISKPADWSVLVQLLWNYV